ncbi:uncharacterized protein LOC113208220 isoform X1 [Frankliniella occidentalis]|uniref:Uncharacterized protein LOC113208220 isoform X1 n=1 Tax=Frankliniella occidentalis TaxID=133901 RepID=A0A6J1SI70_FRAOC|nr:uncharacterized protein LOC113208220 isoform X1 [Frankliniella occidentalis]
MLLLLAIVVLLTSYCEVEPATKWINSFAGPWVATLGPLKQCPGGREDDVVRFNLLISQFRHPSVDAQKMVQRLSGNVTVDQQLNNKGASILRAATRSNNQWKENAMVLKFAIGCCQSLMEYFPDFTRNIYKLEPNEYQKGGKPCIIPKGIYYADEEPVNWTIPKVPVLPYGLWRLQFSFDLGTESNPKRIGCFITEATTHPRL